MKVQSGILSVIGVSTLAAAAVALQANAQSMPSPGPSASPSAGPSAAPSASPGPSASPSISVVQQFNDVVALNYLHDVNGQEIQEGQSAQGRAQSLQAQDLAQAMVTDHQQNDQLVTQLASQKGISLLGFQQSGEEAAAAAFLASVPSSQFDELFMLHEKNDHQVVLNNLQAMTSEQLDPDVLNLINQTIPIVQKHIGLASATPQPSGSPSAGPSAAPSGSPTPLPSP